MFLIFKLLKLLIWLAGLAVVVYFGMRFFGYDVNWQYFNYLKEDRDECEAKIRACKAEFMAKGYENPDCNIKECVKDTVENSSVIIKKK